MFLYNRYMKELLGSKVKEDVLLYLGSRGGMSGRGLALILRRSPTPVFKALRQLEKNGIIKKSGTPSFYVLNPDCPYFDEIISMIDKKLNSMKKPPRFFPHLPEERKIDPFAVHELRKMLGRGPQRESLAQALRKKHAGNTFYNH